ncbi:outer membrane protein assembly factor BamB family protein [Lacihabitans lacunae]|uniref:PQQ-binding-like beta-propeller repeat protein n=1 Tax=Lacihabitans lacunae TaxID=1028214 RepID=A0ABV7YYY9_9BACT
MRKKYALVISLFALTLFTSLVYLKNLDITFGSEDNWADYLGGPDRNHYSKLDQITAQNVNKLEIAWEYSTPDSGQMQMNPLVIDGVLYGVDANVQAFALNASTGKEIWRFGDPVKNASSTSRGASFWQNKDEKRVLFTAGANLWALDALTGKPIKTFGENGKVDLHIGLPENSQEKYIISNTPGTVFENLIYMPVRVSEGDDAAIGDLRAFDVISGKLVWTFHTIPHPGEYGYKTFPPDAYKNESIGAVNNWAGMSVDIKTGILYVPTGSAAYDFYGGNRPGKNLFANTLIALDARTGKRIWHYQTIHHDIWDRDLPAPPNLISISKGGKKIDAVAQVTKHGYVFIFDRKIGKPVFPIKEVKVPKSMLPGEKTNKTQPLPKLPLPFARQSNQLTENDISPYAQNRAELIKKFISFKREQFDPPSEQGTLIMPGFDGGPEWGGAAIDPEGVMYVNANEMAWIIDMKKTEAKASNGPLGEQTYTNYCQACHGKDREGNKQSGYPSLVKAIQKYDKKKIFDIINSGRGMMPGFAYVKDIEKQALIQFLFNEEKKEMTSNYVNTKYVSPYKMQGYTKFLDDRGLPAIAPPWGTLNAIDLNTGALKWKIVLGDEPLLKKEGITGTGSENYGGPIVTAGKLVFIAATKDAKIRAFDKETGKMVWEHDLPAAAFATPATYKLNGKQYVVVACGGTKLGTPKGNKIVAFALPN